MLKTALDLVKSFQGLIGIGVSGGASAGSVPLLASRFLPTINPKIIEDSFWLAIAFAVIVGAVGYIVSTRVRWPILIGLALWLGCYGGIYILTTTDTFAYPLLAALLARALFLGFFIGCALCIGWVVARIQPM